MEFTTGEGEGFSNYMLASQGWISRSLEQFRAEVESVGWFRVCHIRAPHPSVVVTVAFVLYSQEGSTGFAIR